jgi:hypothetical protein
LSPWVAIPCPRGWPSVSPRAGEDRGLTPCRRALATKQVAFGDHDMGVVEESVDGDGKGGGQDLVESAGVDVEVVAAERRS